MDNHYKKYLKYKRKYLNQKYLQIGSGVPIRCNKEKYLEPDLDCSKDEYLHFYINDKPKSYIELFYIRKSNQYNLDIFKEIFLYYISSGISNLRLTEKIKQELQILDNKLGLYNFILYPIARSKLHTEPNRNQLNKTIHISQMLNDIIIPYGTDTVSLEKQLTTCFIIQKVNITNIIIELYNYRFKIPNSIKIKFEINNSTTLQQLYKYIIKEFSEQLKSYKYIFYTNEKTLVIEEYGAYLYHDKSIIPYDNSKTIENLLNLENTKFDDLYIFKIYIHELSPENKNLFIIDDKSDDSTFLETITPTDSLDTEESITEDPITEDPITEDPTFFTI
jgi:hypothetical protein